MTFCVKIGYLTLGNWIVTGSQVTFYVYYRPEGADKELEVLAELPA